MSAASSRGARTQVCGLPWAFWIIWVAVLVLWLGRFVVPFMSAFLNTERDFEPATIGVVTATFGAGGVLANLVGGYLADRFGKIPVIATSQIASAAILFVVPAQSTAPALAITLFFYGLAGHMAAPALSSAIAEIVTPDQRERAYSLYVWAINCGFALGPLAANALVSYSFALIFYVEAGMLTLVAIWLIASRSTRHRTGVRQPSMVPLRAAYGRVFRDRVFLVFTAIMIIFMVVYSQGTTTLSVVLTGYGYSVQQFGLLLSINGLLLCCFQLPFVRILESTSKSVMLSLAFSMTALGYLVQVFAQVWWHYAVAVVLWTLGELGVFPVATTIVADLAPHDLRGVYQGIYGLIWSGGYALGPLLGGLAIATIGARGLWSSCVAVLIIAVLLLTITRAGREQRVMAGRTIPTLEN